MWLLKYVDPLVPFLVRPSNCGSRQIIACRGINNCIKDRNKEIRKPRQECEQVCVTMVFKFLTFEPRDFDQNMQRVAYGIVVNKLVFELGFDG